MTHHSLAFLFIGLTSCIVCAQEPQAVLRIRTTARYQTIDGFGW